MNSTITSINESYKQTEELCRWEISIFRDCKGSIYFLWIHYIAIVLCSLVTICALGLLIYKIFFKKSTLWNERMFEPIIGFLLWLILYGIFRSVYMLIIACDWLYTWFIFKAIVSSLGWLFGIFAIATYLVGIFKALPKLAFHQRTTSRRGNRTSRRFIPTDKSVAFIYWLFLIIMGILAIIFSYLKGYFQSIGNEYYFGIYQNLLLIMLGLSQLIGIIFFIKYGRLLVGLLNEAVQLLGANDNKNNPITLNGLNQYRTYLMKLKLINFILLIVLCWFTCMSILLTPLRRPLGRITAFSVTLAAITLLGSAILMLISLAVVFHSEIFRRYTSKVMDITSSIHHSEISRISLDNEP